MDAKYTRQVVEPVLINERHGLKQNAEDKQGKPIPEACSDSVRIKHHPRLYAHALYVHAEIIDFKVSSTPYFVDENNARIRPETILPD
ncbi:MAG TPA: hypothetical protein QF550_06240, partial [Arenicellales bacterium]|jgi:hypothetical protein|nr:hypothetical protein [Arenicellales bacterium]